MPPQENDAFPQTNSAVTLDLVHQVFQGLIDMSNALGQNSSSISTWQNINTHLAAQPTTTPSEDAVQHPVRARTGRLVPPTGPASSPT